MNHYPLVDHGYGPFTKPYLGDVLHVNQSNGRLENFFAASKDVTPNFQVYKVGPPTQYLPLDWQPWCQSAGNQQYTATETEGYNYEPLNDNQLHWCAVILAARRDNMDMEQVLANSPGQRGFGWHGMGGVPWGNHPNCPGDIRKLQRTDILKLANPPEPIPPIEEDMTPNLVQYQNGFWLVAADLTSRVHIVSDADFKAVDTYARVIALSDAQMAAIPVVPALTTGGTV